MYSLVDTPPRARGAMALSKVSEDQHRSVFGQLCNVLEPRLAVHFGSASRGLWALTQALRQQLRAEHEAILALCLKMGMRSCKELREAKEVDCHRKRLSEGDLATLGTLGPVLPALEGLLLSQSAGPAGPYGVQRLAEGLGAGALPAMTRLSLVGLHVGDAGATALAAALGRGALPQLHVLHVKLDSLQASAAAIGDAGLAALLAPPLPAGALPPPTGVLTKLRHLDLHNPHISDAGCAALATALDSGSLPALEKLSLSGNPASAAAKAAVQEALRRSMLRRRLAELATPLKVRQEGLPSLTREVCLVSTEFLANLNLT